MNGQTSFGEIAIQDIQLDPNSRDDIPAVLYGIQHMYINDTLRENVFSLLERELLQNEADSHADPKQETDRKKPDPNNGRPGMDLWQVLVLALLKQGVGCDFDRLAELASKHVDVQRMLGNSGVFLQPVRYPVRTVSRNVQLLTPELLEQVNLLVVKEGLRLAGWEPGKGLQARCDSYVVETNVEYPTDYRLLRDALVCLLREVVSLSSACGLAGWRQAEHWKNKTEELFRDVRKYYRKKERNTRVKAQLRGSRQVLKRVRRTRRQLLERGTPKKALGELDRLLGHADLLDGQVRRRLLEGEKIPHEEKVFSIHEDYTRWISKGKAGQPVELGVPLSIVESRQGYLLGAKIHWEEQDVEVAAELMESVKEDFPDLKGCSFDKGYSSVPNIRAVGKTLEQPAMPKRGKLSKADKARQGTEWYGEARRKHPGVESAINNLEQRGLDRVREKGKGRFEEVVWRSILALNVHRIGRVVRAKERGKLQQGRAIRRGLRHRERLQEQAA